MSCRDILGSQWRFVISCVHFMRSRKIPDRRDIQSGNSECISHMLWHTLMLPLLRDVIGHDLGRVGILQLQ